MRINRKNNQIRELAIVSNYLLYPEGSVLISLGNTKVICNASVVNSKPKFLEDKNQGWLTAEYSMLPRSTNTRMIRDVVNGKQNGRSLEIQRLIGRSLRSCLDLNLLGDKTIIIDCDVIQADGGTRTASITGGYVALYLAINKLLANGKLNKNPIKNHIAAISVGINKDEYLLDLDYIEDSSCDSDINVVMNNENKIVEIQGTAEKNTFSSEDLNILIELAKEGINNLFIEQEKIINKYKKK